MLNVSGYKVCVILFPTSFDGYFIKNNVFWIRNNLFYRNRIYKYAPVDDSINQHINCFLIKFKFRARQNCSVFCNNFIA